MKTIVKLLIVSVLLSSCGKYVSLTKESYDLLNNNSNILKVKAKFERQIELEYLVQDTVIASVDSRGVCNFKTVKRVIDPIPAGAKIKIKDTKDDVFMVEFVNYKLTLPMVRTTSDNYIILTTKDNVVGNTRYVVKDNDPNIMIKIKNSNARQNISLKK